MQSIRPRNHIDVWLNNIKMNLNTPKKPIFKTTLAKRALISVLTSTCTSGNHICRGHIGYLIANIIKIIIQIKIFKYKLSKKQISIKFIREIQLKWTINKMHAKIHKTELKEQKKIKK